MAAFRKMTCELSYQIGRNTLQHTATHCNILQHILWIFILWVQASSGSFQLWHIVAHCSILQHTTAHCSTLQHTAAHYSTQQHTAAHSSTLQHTAAHCNTLQHIIWAIVLWFKVSHGSCNTLQQTATHCNAYISLTARATLLRMGWLWLVCSFK